MEYSRLQAAIFDDVKEGDMKNLKSVGELAKALGHACIVQKGQTDLISDGKCKDGTETGDARVIECTVEGSNRRCGGQGDILAGTMGTFLGWSQRKDITSLLSTEQYVIMIVLFVVFASVHHVISCHPMCHVISMFVRLCHMHSLSIRCS
jgi:NAD(P)H-hydrate repair Nnr-like enzyme with NAD(P)H-hydrate dehydratase domain